MQRKKIFAITVGANAAASTKYRLVQYEEFFKQHDIDVTYVNQHELTSTHLDDMAKYDLIINQKCLLPSRLTKKILSLKNSHLPIIFDFDDSIYTRPGKPYSWITRWRVQNRLKLWLKNVNCITTANQFLKGYASRYSQDIEIIPMALDLTIWKPKPRQTHAVSSSDQIITIGWAGAPVNLYHLERLESVLTPILDHYPQVRLMVYSGKRPRLKCRHDYVPFKEGEEPSFIQKLDIGLLPLTHEEFTFGKSPIKAIQYLACGVPVVGDVFGATSEILNRGNSLAVHSQEEWKEALKRLIEDEELRRQLGQSGREHIEQFHNIDRAQDQWLQLLTRLWKADLFK